MAAFGVDVEFGRDLGVFQFEKIKSSVFDVDRIVFSVDDEGRRGVGSDVDFGIGREILIGESEIAGINNDGEVGTAGELVGSVNGLIEAFLEMGGECRRKMGAGGKTEYADAIGSKVPQVGVGANHAEGALGVLESGVGFRKRAGIGYAIFDQDTVHVDVDEPIADFGAFEVDGEDMVATTWKNDYGGVGVRRLGRIESECGIGDIAEADERFAGDEIVFGGRCVGFGSGIRSSAGSASGPELQRGAAGGRLPRRLLGGDGGRSCQESQDQE